MAELKQTYSNIGNQIKEYNNHNRSGEYAKNINVAEFRHLEHTQKQVHDHEREMKELDHKQALEMLDRKAGSFGQYFGIEDSASKNITLIIIIIFLFIVFALIFTFYKESPHSQFVEIVWNSAVPVLTLALGYIFGKQ